MMFRNVQEDEESGSDWDDLTPHASPQHSPPSPPPQPHSSSLPQPHTTTIQLSNATLQPHSHTPHLPISHPHLPISHPHPPFSHSPTSHSISHSPSSHLPSSHPLSSHTPSSHPPSSRPPSSHPPSSPPPSSHPPSSNPSLLDFSHQKSQQKHHPSRHHKKRRTNYETEFTSLSKATPLSPNPPLTPPPTHTAYTITSSPSPSSSSPLPLQTHSPHTSPSHAHTPTPSPPHQISPPDQTLPPEAGNFSPAANGNHKPPRGFLQFDVVKELSGVVVEGEGERGVPGGEAVMAKVADRSERLIRRCSREIFSTLRLFSDIVITFLLECTHYLAYHIVRKLCCGLFFTIGAALGKPALTDCFNAFLLPLALCFLHVCRAGKMALSPVGDCVVWCVGACVRVASACKLVEVTTASPSPPHSFEVHSQPSHPYTSQPHSSHPRISRH